MTGIQGTKECKEKKLSVSKNCTIVMGEEQCSFEYFNGLSLTYNFLSC